MLLHFGVTPYIVFDGDYLPSKAKTENERAKRREDSKLKGLELYRLRKPSLAQLEFQKAVDVTPEMARQLIDELKKIGVQYIVAPYEADAQMVYLEKKGIIQGILSEDSDLLVFGAKRLLTKLDQYGDCIEVNRTDFTSCKEISLIGWTDAEFRRMAILSGCDYLASINRMGLKSAYRLVRKYKTIEKIVRMLQFDGQYYVPTGYLEAFYKAELTFLYQRVFCPVANKIVTMTELEQGSEPQDLSFIGEPIEQRVAIGIAKGDLDPMTKAPIRVQSSALATPPKTPWTNPRKTTIGENSLDMKEHKSIETFFTSKRTPLAELDVNTFTPSPTQEELLRQNEGASWESSPAPVVTSSLHTSASASSRGSRPALSSSGANISKMLNEFGTSKKRKMMSDKEAFQSPSEVQGTSSKFFTAAAPDTTPTLRGRVKARKKATDFNVWSDDSVEDAMAELAANAVSSGPLKELVTKIPDKAEEINFNPLTEEPRREIIIGENSQASHSSTATVRSETSTSTASTNLTSSAQSIAKTVDDHVKAELAELVGNYSYEMKEATQDTKQEEARPQTDSVSSQVTPKPLLPRQKSMSALQSLGVRALSRSKSSMGLLRNPLGHVESFDTLLSRPSDKGTDKPAQPPPSLPLAHTFGPDATIAGGSEDAIIPNSEDEGSDVVSELDEVALKPNINFGRFAFNG